MFVAERFLFNLLEEHGKHPISTDGRRWEEGGTWYPPPQALPILEVVEHHIHTSFEKSIIERTIQYIKDRTIEGFDDYFPCQKKEV